MSWIWTVGGVWLSAERVLRRRKRERADRVRSERRDIFQGLVRNVRNGILATVRKQRYCDYARPLWARAVFLFLTLCLGSVVVLSFLSSYCRSPIVRNML